MTRRFVVLLIAFVTAGAGAELAAHDHFRIIGTLTTITDDKIDVKNKAERTIPIHLDKQTEIFRDKTKVDRRDLRVGQSVVVDAYGDTEDDSLALKVRIVPAIQKR
jgi:hypothetical protein